MNPMMLSTVISACRKAWVSFNKYREEKAVEAYDVLQSSAQAALEKGQDFIDSQEDLRSAVTKQAHKRLDAAKKEAESRRAEVEKLARRSSKDIKKAARQARKTVEKKVDRTTGRRRSCKLGKCLGISVALLAVLAAAVAAAARFLDLSSITSALGLKQETPAQPPRREDYAETSTHSESTLVYSTVTPSAENAEGSADAQDSESSQGSEKRVLPEAEVADSPADRAAARESATEESQKDSEEDFLKDLNEQLDALNKQAEQKNSENEDAQDTQNSDAKKEDKDEQGA